MVELDLGKSLKSNLIIWFLVFSLVPFSILALLGYSKFRSTTEETYIKSLQSLARAQAEDIGLILKENLLKLEMISGRTDLIMSRLEEYVKKNPDWYDIFMTDNKGRGLTTKGISIDVSTSDFFKTVMSTKKSTISSGMIPDKNEPTIILAVPILDPNGNPYGVLGAYYPVKI
ncbi:MAG: PDC sensor domain-containing protein, partial [bacterium]